MKLSMAFDLACSLSAFTICSFTSLKGERAWWFRQVNVGFSYQLPFARDSGGRKKSTFFVIFLFTIV